MVQHPRRATLISRHHEESCGSRFWRDGRVAGQVDTNQLPRIGCQRQSNFLRQDGQEGERGPPLGWPVSHLAQTHEQPPGPLFAVAVSDDIEGGGELGGIDRGEAGYGRISRLEHGGGIVADGPVWVRAVKRRNGRFVESRTAANNFAIFSHCLADGTSIRARSEWRPWRRTRTRSRCAAWGSPPRPPGPGTAEVPATVRQGSGGDPDSVPAVRCVPRPEREPGRHTMARIREQSCPDGRGELPVVPCSAETPRSITSGGARYVVHQGNERTVLGVPNLLRPPRAAKGLTLVELVVVAVLASALFYLLFNWVLSLIGVAGEGNAIASLSSDTAYTRQLFSTDIAAAAPCDQYGLGSPFVTVSPTEISFTAFGASGVPELILWRLSGGNLERALVTGSTGSCTFSTTNPAWTTVLSNATAPGNQAFTPWEQGVPQTASSAYGTCGPSGPSCMYDEIELHVTKESLGPNNPVSTIDAMFSVNLAASRIGG